MGNPPKIFCFVNSGKGTDWQHVMAMAEDGCYLGGHISSNESFAKHDIGVTFAESSRHADYRAHYPDGYELEWIDEPSLKHEGLAAAYALNQAQAPKEEEKAS